MAIKQQRIQHFKLRSLGKALALAAALLFLNNCGKKDKIEPTYSSIYSKVFSTACIECHVPGTTTTDQDLVQIDFTSASTGYSTLVNQTVQGDSVGGSGGPCGAVKLVDPGNASGSYLAQVLFSDVYTDPISGTNCTPYAVHLQDQNLSADEEAAIKQWINDGAQNN